MNSKFTVGELVRVKPYEEIFKTTHGFGFVDEMKSTCQKEYRIATIISNGIYYL